MTAAEEPETTIKRKIEAARAELARQSNEGKIYYRPEDGMADGRIDLRKLVEAIMDADEVEAHALLELIDAEFQSDPMSVQCFDLRIVERVRLCVAKRQRGAGSSN